MKSKFPRVIIFCLETSDYNKSDAIYVKELLERFFLETIYKKSITIKYLFLGGKKGYKNKKIINEINKYLSMKNNTNVIYVFDKDKFDTDINDINFIKNVTYFCKKNNYDIIWFVRNIEEVLLGHNAREKTKSAIEFRKHNNVYQVDKNILKNKDCMMPHTSNFLLVMEKLLGKSYN